MHSKVPIRGSIDGSKMTVTALLIQISTVVGLKSTTRTLSKLERNPFANST